MQGIFASLLSMLKNPQNIQQVLRSLAGANDTGFFFLAQKECLLAIEVYICSGSFFYNNCLYKYKGFHAR
jgi:hypothetical protein